MLFGDVDIPRAVLDAHRRDELVVFVGAGASVDSPSGLPLFTGLAERIAASAGMTIDPGKDLTAELGRLEAAGVGVRSQVEQIIGDPRSRPNRMHTAIARLAVVAPTLRIVTTNYDPHLTTELDSIGVTHTEYAAPALPLGDDFDGIVYLHGKVGRAESCLVATDDDFGNAYLLAAWAARFLEAMFRRYTVLFVGYSHADVVMQFIGRALRASDRFILIDEPAESRWSLLGITPIGYRESETGSHEAAVVALERLADYAAMGLVEHNAEVSRLLANAPSLTLAEDEYLSEIVANEETVGLFTRHARGEEWLRWLTEHPEFRMLLDPTMPRAPVRSKLAGWLAEHYLFDEPLLSAGLAATMDRGPGVSIDLWEAIGWRLHAHPSRRSSGGTTQPRPDWQRPLLSLLAAHVPLVPTRPWLELALGATDLGADRDSALLLLDVLLAPVQDRSSTTSRSGHSITVRAEPSQLGLAWDSHLRPQIQSIANELLAICEHHLRSADRSTAVATRPPLYAFTPIAADEDRRFRQHHRGIEPLVTITLDVVSHLATSDPAAVDAILAVWAASPVRVLQRLALAATAARIDLDPSDKVSFLLGRTWLWDAYLHSDVVGYIGSAGLEGADDALVTQLLDEIERGPTEVDDDRATTMRGNMIALVADATHSDSAAQRRDGHPAAVAPIDQARFDFAVRQDRPPMTLDELHRRLTVDPRAAADALATYRSDDRPFFGTGWWDVTQLIGETVATHPCDGLRLIDAFDDDPAVVAAVCQSWQHLVQTDIATDIIRRLDELELAKHLDAITRMLDPTSTNSFEWAAVPSARDLAARCWTFLDDNSIEANKEHMSNDDNELNRPDEWLSAAINHPAGRLTAFWLHAVQYDWRHVGDTYTRLDEQTTRVFDAMFAGHSRAHHLAQVRLASQLHFLYGADPTWATAALLPVLQWDDLDRAARLWSGFALWGRWNDTLLDLGLLDAYRGAIEHHTRLGHDELEALIRHVTSIMIFSATNRSDLLDILTGAAEPSTRRLFIDNVAWALADAEADVADAQWDRWMRNYWENRLAGVPRVLDDSETTSLLRWVHIVGDACPEAAKLALRRRAAFPEHTSPSDLLGDQLITRHTEIAGKLLAHALRDTDPAEFYEHVDLRGVLDRLKGQVSSDVQHHLDEQAIRFGLGS